MPLRARVLLPFAVAFFALGPALTLFSDTPLSIERLSATAFHIALLPLWVLVAFLWAVLAWFVFLFLRMLRYYMRPSMFAVTKGHVEVGGVRISKGQVEQVRWRGAFGDVVIEGPDLSVILHPQLTRGGIAALKRHYRRKFDHKGFTDVTWLVGN